MLCFHSNSRLSSKDTMRLNLFIFATVCVLLTTQVAATDPKTSCVNKFLKFFSTFFSSNQIGTYADAAIGQVIKNANSSEINCINGAAPTLLKLYPKITKKIKQANGDTAKTTTAYQFANKKFTLKLSKNLVKKCKSKLSNDEWSKGTSLLKGYINFDVLGFSV
ncbi:hypothetical protein M3Y96_00760700 [Aphelenchoides besseyi]|nr:hypothetical protein M3Y96_00760700 [Aphelenchoides besseyi]